MELSCGHLGKFSILLRFPVSTLGKRTCFSNLLQCFAYIIAV